MIVVLISGRGSNLQALLDAGLPVSAVISNVAGAKGLEAAASAAIDEFRPRLVALAGFMRVLTPGFVERYRGRLLNIHPSLLPEFAGLDTHRRALEAGAKRHGCTVHFVTAELDHGPIVIQAAVPMRAGDTPASLAARVLKQEHVIYPRAVRWFLDGRLVIEGDRVRVKGEEADENAQMVIAAD